MTAIRTGIIGTGGMGRHHANQISQRDDACIAALCDTDGDSMAQLQRSLGGEEVPQFRDWKLLLAEGALDAVLVATPHTQHGEQVRQCLQAGLHVLVEKPMATTAADARGILDAAADSGKVLAIAYQRHGEGRFIRARKLLLGGAIGEIRLVHAIIAQDCLSVFQPGASWRADPALSGGGHFMDTGSHINDILLWATGLEPRRVQAFINQEGTDVDVLTAVTVEFTSGAVGTLAYTSLSPEWREEFTFYGTEGVIRFGAAEPLMVHRRGEDILLPRPAGGGASPAHNFIDAIQGRAEVQAPGICGLRVAQLTEGVYASRASGRPAEVAQ
ncbi:MAG: Gfo/Idh/MocA family oxidoreductase [Gemmatimonadetes bacterium]|nr:Gfo/Idh/MocA family oxidoreductase [Gemmatimonadota bacterium]